MANLFLLTVVGCSSNNLSDSSLAEQKTDSQSVLDSTLETHGEQDTVVNTADETIEDEEKAIEITEVILTSNEPMDYNCWQIAIDGLEEYTELAGESITDTPTDGNIYLVLYLKVKNSTGHEDYFNYNYLTAQIDGNDVETTYLINNPHQYNSLYTDLPQDEAIGGFLVWEVPSEWKELSVTYTGFEAQDHVRPVIKVSRDDLSTPVDYDPVYYY